MRLQCCKTENKFRRPLSLCEMLRATIAFPGFNDLGRTVTPVFLLMDHFLYQFSALSEKMKKIYRLEV